MIESVNEFVFNITFKDTALFAIAIFVYLTIIFFIIIGRKKINIWSHILIAIFFISIIVYIKSNFFPLSILIYKNNPGLTYQYSFIPFYFLREQQATEIFRFCLMRIICTIPMGFIYPVFKTNISFRKILLLSIYLCVATEFLKVLILLLNRHINKPFDFMYSILTIIGIIIGYIFYKCFKDVIEKKVNRRGNRNNEYYKNQ